MLIRDFHQHGCNSWIDRANSDNDGFDSMVLTYVHWYRCILFTKWMKIYINFYIHNLSFNLYHSIRGKKTTTSFHMRKNLWIDEKKTFESVLSNFYILLCLEFRRKKEHQMKHKERSLNIFMAHKRSRWPIHMHTHSRKISAEEDVKSMASAQKVQNLSTFYMVIKRT